MKKQSKETQYTVKQLAETAGVSVRTLHYYDEIGLLKPTAIGKNGYRYYGEEAILRLQQILFFREMDMDLMNIKSILHDKNFNLLAALQAHRSLLQEKIARLQTLIKTVDGTILHITGEHSMSKKKIFEGFSEEKQKEHERMALERYGDFAKRSQQLWNSYSDEKKEQIKLEGQDIYLDLVANMDKGPQSAEVQAILERWHQHLRYFYEPSIEVLRGLGETYHDDPDFNATFTAIHPDLPAFLKSAIAVYVDELETQWLKKELNILEE